jgi:hypothetical protein
MPYRCHSTELGSCHRAKQSPTAAASSSRAGKLQLWLAKRRASFQPRLIGASCGLQVESHLGNSVRTTLPLSHPTALKRAIDFRVAPAATRVANPRRCPHPGAGAVLLELAVVQVLQFNVAASCESMLPHLPPRRAADKPELPADGACAADNPVSRAAAGTGVPRG